MAAFCRTILAVALTLATLPARAGDEAATADYEKAMEVMHDGMRITYTGDSDTDFARGMVPHHQGAVDMAEVLLAHGDDPVLRKLASRIIVAQKQEIGIMKRWLTRRGLPEPEAQQALEQDRTVKGYRDAMHRMHEQMNIVYSNDADADFVYGMIPHHQGAIEMADVQIAWGEDPELRDIAADIVRSQQQEIALMRGWLAQKGLPAEPALKAKGHSCGKHGHKHSKHKKHKKHKKHGKHGHHASH